jgi:dTMP kinase
MSGQFISFEGGEGSGKSTQLRLLTAAFEKSGLPFLATREPGGSAGAEKIRSLLVSGEVDSWDALTETILFNAARADHINKLLKPALTQGKTVICDRFLDSTIVYQGIGKGLGTDYIKNLHHILFDDFMPALTIILDIKPEDGLVRANKRAGDENRFEKLDIEFHQKIRAGFLKIAEMEQGRCVVLDANQDEERLHKQIVETIRSRCGTEL